MSIQNIIKKYKDHKRYNESLRRTLCPVTKKQLEGIHMDLLGLSNYLVETGKDYYALTEEELSRFIPAQPKPIKVKPIKGRFF